MSSKQALLEARKGRIALTQIREVQRLLNEAGVPEIVEIDDSVSNGPQCRLKWFLLRRKDVKPEELTNQEREPIGGG